MTTLWPSADALEVATPHQRERYALATARPVGILGGNPGGGKTFCTAQIIREVIRQHGISEVSVFAPTGKAGQRITEVMLGHGITGIEATTIHRGLGVSRNGHDQKGWGFVHNRTNPLRKRFVFIDESSMVGGSLAASLLDALLPGTHLLWIGDFAQLPPVEHGAPLRDMIAAGLPYGELTETIRNEGDIVRACRDVKEGRPFTPSRDVDIGAGHNLRHIEASRPALQLGCLANMLRNPPPGIDPVWHVQVLCATNEASDVSRKKLNELMQGILNPAGARADGIRFRVGDKVICTTNGMIPMAHCPSCIEDRLWAEAEWDGKVYQCCECGRAWGAKDCLPDLVANGEIGRVKDVAKGLVHVAFDSPKRTIRVAGEWLAEFDLAYAVTVHKMQGSQAPVVIGMVDDSRAADMVCSWQWHRTAWSRAEKLCVTIGKKAAIDRQCRKDALSSRKTFLKELLEGKL